MIMSGLVDAVGNALEFTLLGVDEVMGIHRFRSLTPLFPLILEVANRLFFLGINTDRRILVTLKQLLDSPNVAKLLLSWANLSALNTFAIRFEAIVLLFEQPTYRARTDRSNGFAQRLA